MIQFSKQYNLGEHLLRLSKIVESNRAQEKSQSNQQLEQANSSSRALNFSTNYDINQIIQQSSSSTGMYIDARDSVNNWCVAQVTVNLPQNDKIKIHFDGWSEKYDEWVKRSSTKIAPFRRFTTGYTGNKKVAIRDFKLNYQYMGALTSRVNEIIETDFLCLGSAHQVTQFVRGELFFHIDSQLQCVPSHQGTNLSQDDLKKIFELMKSVQRLIIKWIEMIQLPQFQKAYVNGQQHPLLQVVDFNVAVANCGHELFEIIGKFQGHCLRSRKFFEQFPQEYIHEGKGAVRQDKISQNGYMLSMINHFVLDLNGINKLLAFIQAESSAHGKHSQNLSLQSNLSQSSDSVSQKQNQASKLCPLYILRCIGYAFSNIKDVFEQQLRLRFTELFLMVIVQRLEQMTDLEIKLTEKDTLQKLFIIIQFYKQIDYGQEAANEAQEIMELKVAYRYLKSPYFERRIRGLNEFKDIYNKCMNAKLRKLPKNKNDQSVQNLVYSNYLTLEILADWIIKQQVMEFIFYENPHDELIKRSGELLQLLTEHTKMISEKIIDIIWSCCCTGKHENIIRASLDIVQDIAIHLEPDKLEYLFEKVKAVQPQNYNDKMVLFLKKLTINCLKNYYQSQKKAMSSSKQDHSNTTSSFSSMMNNLVTQGKQSLAGSIGQSTSQSANSHSLNPAANQAGKSSQVVLKVTTQYYDLNVFWQIAQCSYSKQVTLKVKETAVQSLIEILAACQQRDLKDYFIQLALENLRHDQSVYISLKFLKNLFVTFPLDAAQNKYSGKQAQSQQDTTIQDLLQDLMQENDVIQVVVNNAVSYMQRHFQGQAAVNQQEQTSVEAKDSTQASMQDQGVSHEDYICMFVHFVEFLVVHTRGINLKFQHVDTMFQIFITDATTILHKKVEAMPAPETREFFNFLTKENENAKTRERRYLLDQQVRFDVFAQIMCNENRFIYSKVSQQGFQCFKTLFLQVNAENRFLQYNGNNDQMSVLNFKRLIGLETLWKISVECQDSRVREDCRNFLCDLHLTRSKSRQVLIQGKPLLDLFFKKTFVYLKDINQNLKQALQSEHQHLITQQISCLKLIKTIIYRFDMDHITEEAIADYDTDFIRNIKCNLVQQDLISNYDVQINYLQSFWQLTRKFSNILKLKLSELDIMTKNGPLDTEIYDKSIKDFNIQELNFQRVEQKFMEDNFPSYILGYNSEYIKQLISISTADENEATTREILNLYEVLPINKKLKNYMLEEVNKIKATPQDSAQPDSQQQLQPNWSSIFSWNPQSANKKQIHNTLYMLLVLEDCLMDRKGQASVRSEDDSQARKKKHLFTQNLITKGGLHFVINLFLSIDKSGLELSSLKTKTLHQLLKLLTTLFVKNQLLSNAQGQPQAGHNFSSEQSQQLLSEMINNNLFLIESYVKTVQRQQVLLEQGQNLVDQKILKNDHYFIGRAFIFLAKMYSLYPAQIQCTLYQFPGAQDMYKQALIDIDNEAIQQRTVSNIYSLSMQFEQLQTIPVKPSVFFMKLFLNSCLEHASAQTENLQRTKQFFLILVRLLQETQVSKQIQQRIMPIKNLVDNLIKMILERPIYEVSARDEDHALSGLFITLKIVLHSFPQLRKDLQQDKSFLHYLLNECLFHKDTSQQLQVQIKRQGVLPKCKNLDTREKCLMLIQEICYNDPNLESVNFMIKYLKDHVAVQTFWRTSRKADWSINAQQQEVSSTGFVGIKNLGNTCYMNSLFQQLYMVPAFRKAILEVQDQQEDSVPQQENLLFQLKKIFGGLMELDQQFLNPSKFCNSFKEYDGQPADPLVQKDVDEFFNQLMEKIENQIKGTKEEKVMNNLFKGEYVHELICKGCPHYFEREEAFLGSILKVQNKPSIYESLEDLIKGEMLEGDNAYECGQCEKKVDTFKRQCFKRLPNVLILILKRFEFDFDTMTKVKINDYCEFPNELDMYKYTQQYLSKQDLLKEMEEKNLTRDDLSQDKKIILDQQLPENYYKYNLKGTIVHLGTADQGHYYSFIQDRESSSGNWFEFNDEIVRPFDPLDIPNETFGGEDYQVIQNLKKMQKQQNADQAVMQSIQAQQIKQRNAYVVIYERKDFINMEQFNELIDDNIKNIVDQNHSLVLATNTKLFKKCQLPVTVSQQIQITPQIHEMISKKNKKFWLSKYIFNKTYIDQIYLIFKDLQINEDNDYGKYSRPEVDLQTIEGPSEFAIFRFLITFCLTTSFRANQRTSVPLYINKIRECLSKNIALCIWLVETFSNQDLVKELLIDCPVPDMSRFIAGILKTAMVRIYEFEKDHIKAYCEMLSSQSNNEKLLNFIQTSQKDHIDSHIEYNGNSNSSEITPQLGAECQRLFTSSSLANIFIMKSHSPCLPKLVVMINSFIHLSTCNDSTLSHIQVCNEFFSVFAHFAELGKMSRLYLLKTRTLGRLCDIIQSTQVTTEYPIIVKTGKYSAIVRDSQLSVYVPLFLLDKKFFIETNFERKQIRMGPNERKTLYNSQSPPFTFLIKTIQLLVCSCQIVKTDEASPFDRDNLRYRMDDLEMDLVNNFKAECWWVYSDLKLARNALADMYAHCCFENIQFSQEYSSFVYRAINQQSQQTVHRYGRNLVRLYQIQDSYTDDRCKTGIQAFRQIIQSNTGYWRYCDVIFNMILKLCLKSDEFRQAFSQSEPSLFKQIEQYSSQYQVFPLQQNNRVRLFKEGQFTIDKTIQQKFNFNKDKVESIQRFTKNRVIQLQKIMQNQGQMKIQKNPLRVEDREKRVHAMRKVEKDLELFDSDDEMFYHDFREGDEIDYQNLKQVWTTGYVDQKLDEMVKCQFKNPQTDLVESLVWIETESNKLMPAYSYTRSDKRKLDYFYEQLFLHLQKPASNQQS